MAAYAWVLEVRPGYEEEYVRRPTGRFGPRWSRRSAPQV